MSEERYGVFIATDPYRGMLNELSIFQHRKPKEVVEYLLEKEYKKMKRATKLTVV